MNVPGWRGGHFGFIPRRATSRFCCFDRGRELRRCIFVVPVGHDARMLLPLLLRSWGPETCDPSDLADWHPGNPSRGQCGVTAMVVREVLGGDLVLGQVTAGGEPAGHHYWNRLPDGTELDLTR